jgi:hypothetical protein
VRVPSDSCVIDGEQDQSAAKERKVLQKLETTEDSECSAVQSAQSAQSTQPRPNGLFASPQIFMNYRNSGIVLLGIFHWGGR